MKGQYFLAITYGLSLETRLTGTKDHITTSLSKGEGGRALELCFKKDSENNPVALYFWIL